MELFRTIRENRRHCAVAAAAATLLGLALPAAAAEEEVKTPSALLQKATPSFSPADVVKGAIAPYSAQCDGYGNPGAGGSGYVAVVTLKTAQTPKELAIPGQTGEGLDGTVAFDQAEAAGAYLGQVNLIDASSFIGPNGVLWGYDLAKAADGAERKPAKPAELPATGGIPVRPVEPLLEAAARLFGSRDEPRFPLLPGTPVVAAHKEITAAGPTTVWCGIALAIAEDRRSGANLIVEQCGEYKPQPEGATEDQYFRLARENLAKSVLRMAKNHNVKYREILLGIKQESVREGFVGHAMATVPYVVLAREAVPLGGVERLAKMSLADWEQALQRGPKRKTQPPSQPQTP
jgi:histidine decarboxylase